MSNYLDELAAFWDNFAEDYEAIQQESLFPIAEDLRDFLLEEKIIPCETFLDLAGGTGRYLATIQREVRVSFTGYLSKNAINRSKKS